MALDSEYLAEWVTGTLNADSTMQTLLGGQKVYRELIPRDETLPAVAVGVQAVSPRGGAVLSGPNTHTAQAVIIRASVWGNPNDDFGTISAVVARMDLVLDGRHDVVDTGSGFINECIRSRTVPDIVRPVIVNGDVQNLGWDVFYDVMGKAA